MRIKNSCPVWKAYLSEHLGHPDSRQPGAWLRFHAQAEPGGRYWFQIIYSANVNSVVTPASHSAYLAKPAIINWCLSWDIPHLGLDQPHFSSELGNRPSTQDFSGSAGCLVPNPVNKVCPYSWGSCSAQPLYQHGLIHAAKSLFSHSIILCP
jgi:hypothetical protein